MPTVPARFRSLWFGGAFVILLATVWWGWQIKAACLDAIWDGAQYRTGCYNDIQVLYSGRQLDQHLFPYLETNFEYPAGSGVIAGLVARATDSAKTFVGTNAILIGLATIITFLMLAMLAAQTARLLYFAASPLLVALLFHNWDAVAIALMVAGLFAFHRHKDFWAGWWLGLGAATKLFPGFLLPILLGSRYLSMHRLSRPMLLGAVVGFGVINVPFMLANTAGWWYPWHLQGSRFPNFETHWFMAYDWFGSADPNTFWWTGYPALTGWLSGGLFLFGLAVLVWFMIRHKNNRPYAYAFATLVWFLLTAKVFSPQYSLWLLPFFVLLGLRLHEYVAFIAVDIAALVGFYIFALTLDTPSGIHTTIFLEILILLRYFMLVWLLIRSMRVKELTSTL